MNLKNIFDRNINKRCNGLIFKVVNNCYIDKRLNYHEKRSLLLQRSISCSGCEYCNRYKYNDDGFKDWISDCSYEFMIPSNVNHEDLVQLKLSVTASDLERPHIYDDVEYFFEKINFKDLKCTNKTKNQKI